MCLAVPGRVLSVGEDRRARVDFGGVVKEASLTLLPESSVGDYVIVHAGFALSRVDEDEAKRVFSYLAQLGALEEAAP